MKRAQRQREGRNAFDLIEEATHLLRTAPAATLAVYYLGAIPFVLGLLFFWADMSRSPFAPQHLAEAAFGQAVLFFWMKFWQAGFSNRIRRQAAGENFLPPDLRRGARSFCFQAVIQPTGLFVLPIALLCGLPFPWVYAFYQNAAALDDGRDAGPSALVKKSWRQAKLWPRQNCIVQAILLLFAGCVFLNWTTACLTLPQLCKMLFGIESDFTKSPLAFLNTTFFAAMAGLTYLCVDPVLRTIYALRCFYGESLQTGEDLKAELKPFVQPGIKAAAVILGLFAILLATRVSAEPPGLPAAAALNPGLAPTNFDQVISQTIHERKYLWRMPREQVLEPASNEGVIAKFFDQLVAMIRDWARALLDWIEDLLRKVFLRSHHVESSSASGYGWIMSLQILLYGLVAAAVAALVIFLLRVWRDSRRPPAAVASEPIQPAPDLLDENVRADQLPEDGWTKLARELLERGEFRLAMRAFYLSSLASLAGRNLISIARFKSNRDYERELRRRAHSFPDLLTVFGDNLSIFERIWYGTHEASGELVCHFAAGVERLKADG